MKSYTGSVRVIILLLLISIGVMILVAAPQDPWERKRALEAPDRMAQLANTPNTVVGWPPQVGQVWPTLELQDHTGAGFSFDKLRGKPVLVEIVAMSCAGCQAFSGGGKHGGYGGFPAQSDLGSIEEYFKRLSGGIDLHNESHWFVQIIIYDLNLKPAKPNDIAKWRTHFGLDKYANTFVLTGGQALANSASYNMIPGFILLDSVGKVLYDATGHQPKHDLYQELLPAMGALLRKS